MVRCALTFCDKHLVYVDMQKHLNKSFCSNKSLSTRSLLAKVYCKAFIIMLDKIYLSHLVHIDNSSNQKPHLDS